MMNGCGNQNQNQNTSACGGYRQVGVRYADVHVPVALHPYAEVGEITTQLDGALQVSTNSDCDCGCGLVLSQRLKVCIPITFGVDSDSGVVTATCSAN